MELKGTEETVTYFTFDTEYGVLKSVTYKKRLYNKGLLFYECESFTGSDWRNGETDTFQERKIFYDDSSRIIKEIIKGIDGYEDGINERSIIREITHEYNKDNIRVVSKMKYKGQNDTNENFGKEGEPLYKMYYKEVDEIESIQEFKKHDGIRISESLFLLKEGTTRLTNYKYRQNDPDYDELIEINGYHIVDKYICYRSVYEYDNYKKTMETHFDQGNKILLKKKYENEQLTEMLESQYVDNRHKQTIFENDLIKEINYIYPSDFTFSIYSTIPIFKEIYEYDTSYNLIQKYYYTNIDGRSLLYQKDIFSYQLLDEQDSKSEIKNLLVGVTTKTIKIENESTIPQDFESEENYLITKSISMKYDVNGNLMEKIENNSSLTQLTTYDYDENGNEIEICIFEDDSNIPIESIKTIIEYDKNKNIKMKVVSIIRYNRVCEQTVTHNYYS